MDRRGDGFPELTPLELLNLGAVGNFADLLRGMSKTAFGGRALGEAYEVLMAMIADHDCTVIATISGAMTVAKMGRVLCDMIDTGMIDILVCTGAILTHGLSEAIGGPHYRHDPAVSDESLRSLGHNRVFDTLEMDSNLRESELLMRDYLEDIDWTQPTCSSLICQAIGKRLIESNHAPSILGSAYVRNVPAYVPAFTDSELGLDVARFALARNYVPGKDQDLEELFTSIPLYNPYLDLYDFTTRVMRARKLGIFTIGGGVPRNWGQQGAPFIESINDRLGTHFPVRPIQYGVRICPEPDYWGGLSGCSYSEGISWGKFVSPAEGGRFAEVHCDATIAWPLLIKAVLESRAQ